MRETQKGINIDSGVLFVCVFYDLFFLSFSFCYDDWREYAAVFWL